MPQVMRTDDEEKMRMSEGRQGGWQSRGKQELECPDKNENDLHGKKEIDVGRNERNREKQRQRGGERSKQTEEADYKRRKAGNKERLKKMGNGVERKD